MNRRFAPDLIPRYLLVTTVLAVCLLVACSSGEEGENITGRVTGIESSDIVRFDSLSVIDGDGKTWEFIGGAFAGFTPSHLREHQALGEPVKVWYVVDGDELRVIRIEDGS